MVEKPHSRRGFLKYVGAVVTAIAGVGYLAKDYWYPIIQEKHDIFYNGLFPLPSPTASSTVTHTPIESPVLVPTTTPTPSPTETPTSKTPTEEERQIREFLMYYADVFMKGDADKLAACYTEDAMMDLTMLNSGYQLKKGRMEIYYHYNSCFKNLELTIGPHSFKITGIEVSNDKVTAKANCDYVWMAYNSGIPHAWTEFQLVDMSKLRPDIVRKSLWRIKRETTNVRRLG